MTRNKIETNKAVFLRLQAIVPPEVIHFVSDISAPRYIKTAESERGLLERGRIVCQIEVFPDAFAALIQYENLFFAVLPGESPDQLFPNGMLLQDPHAGVLTLLAAESWFPILKDKGHEAADGVFGSSGGYAPESIRGYFQPFYTLDVTEFVSIPVHDLLEAAEGEPQIVGTAAASRQEIDVDVYEHQLLRVLTVAHAARGSTRLQFSSKSLGLISSIVEQEVSGELAGPLLRALSSVHWAHVYLELYRCVERHYAAPYIWALSRAIAHGSPAELSRHVHQHLVWRPKEDKAILQILERTTPGLVDRLCLMFGVLMEPAATKNERLSRKIYETRNAIAHHRPGLGIEVSRGSWPNVIEGLCELVAEVSSTFGRYL